MNCLIIHGSYRKGNTYKVTNLVKEYMLEKAEISFNEIFLSDYNMQYCYGCNKCFIEGEESCPEYDKIKVIDKKIKDTDILIVTSPTHSLQVPGLMKVFIDHMSYRFHRPIFFTKKALVIATTAGAGENKVSSYIREILKLWGFNYVQKLNIKCLSLNYEPDEKAQQFIRKQAHKFYNKIHSNKLNPPSYKRVFYFNLWRAMAAKGSKNNNADYRYWLNSGMHDKSFAEEIPIGVIKRYFGKAMYSMFLKIMKDG